MVKKKIDKTIYSHDCDRFRSEKLNINDLKRFMVCLFIAGFLFIFAYLFLASSIKVLGNECETNEDESGFIVGSPNDCPDHIEEVAMWRGIVGIILIIIAIIVICVGWHHLGEYYEDIW